MCHQTGEIRQPNAPLARDPWACRRLLDASLLILREVDPQLADNKWAQISPDGKVRPASLLACWCGMHMRVASHQASFFFLFFLFFLFFCLQEGLCKA
jgi:hypothetical protein